MNIREVMQQKVFAVVGDTLNKDKYAFKIKKGLIENGYQTYGVYKELASLNDVPEEIDIIDLCINPVKGLELMKDCRKKCKCVVIQPGAESDELLQYLKEHNFSYLEGCILVGLSLYKNEK